MQNTLENKARLFGQYHVQKVARSPLLNDNLPAGKCYPELALKDENGFYLDLTPLSAITDEDAIEVAKFIGFDKGINEASYIKVGNHVCKNILDGRMHMMNPIHAFNMLDYLRSKGYALPYLDASVEQQIEYGWVKLKEA